MTKSEISYSSKKLIFTIKNIVIDKILRTQLINEIVESLIKIETSTENILKSNNITNHGFNIISTEIRTMTKNVKQHQIDLSNLKGNISNYFIELEGIITERSDFLNEKLELLNEKFKLLEIIFTSISDIAAESNLLALNTAIEASRSREENWSREFAIISEELRKISKQTRELSVTTEKLINQLKIELKDLFNNQGIKLKSNQSVFRKIVAFFTEYKNQKVKTNANIS